MKYILSVHQHTQNKERKKKTSFVMLRCCQKAVTKAFLNDSQVSLLLRMFGKRGDSIGIDIIEERSIAGRLFLGCINGGSGHDSGRREWYWDWSMGMEGFRLFGLNKSVVTTELMFF